MELGCATQELTAAPAGLGKYCLNSSVAVQLWSLHESQTNVKSSRKMITDIGSPSELLILQLDDVPLRDAVELAW